MRIVGGELGGRRFKGPDDRTTRPTPERAREGLASLLQARGAIRGAEVLDLFAGTGALSFEAISRGAGGAVAVDNDARATRAIAGVAAELGLLNKIRVLRLDLLKDPAAAARRIHRAHPDPFDVIFLDPPYRIVDELPPLLDELAARKILSPSALVAIEHATKHPPREALDLELVASYRYGDTSLTVLRRARRGEEVP
jgi:16S rRNA (guanine966-N2)-methyltransferase